VIDVRTHVATHRNAAAVIVRLAERFAGDPRVVFHYFRNSGRPGLADRSTIAVAETARYDGIESRLLEVLEDEYQNGRISEAVCRAGLGNRGAGPGESEAVRRPTGSSGEGSSGAGSEADARSGQGEEDDPLKRREPLFSRRPPQGGKFATREERIAFDREQQESMFGVEAEVSEEERANHAKLERDRFTAQFNELATLGLGPPRPQRRTPRR
jgi:hypothetical protein